MVAEIDSSRLTEVAICVVDDDLDFLNIFRTACAKFHIGNIINIDSFDECINLIGGTNFTHSEYVIFFIDIWFGSEASGFELVSRVRSARRYRYVPIIMMSSSTKQEDVFKSVAAGANCFFHKPTGKRELISGIQNQIEYWGTSVLLPSQKFTLGGGGGWRDGLIAIEGRGPHIDRSRGSPAYAVDRLRQDVLVALLKDLRRLEKGQLSRPTKDRLMRMIVRFREIFVFRGDVFGDNIIESVEKFCSSIKKWAFSYDEKAECWNSEEADTALLKAKEARDALALAIRHVSAKMLNGRDVEELNYNIVDVFQELSDSAEFKSLYLSLKRFSRRAF